MTIRLGGMGYIGPGSGSKFVTFRTFFIKFTLHPTCSNNDYENNSTHQSIAESIQDNKYRCPHRRATDTKAITQEPILLSERSSQARLTREWLVMRERLLRAPPAVVEDSHLNNSMETWHGALQRLIQQKHPTIFNFINHLRKEEAYQASNLTQILAGGSPNRQKQACIAKNRRLKRLMENRSQIPLLDFLKGCALNCTLIVWEWKSRLIKIAFVLSRSRTQVALLGVAIKKSRSCVVAFLSVALV